MPSKERAANNDLENEQYEIVRARSPETGDTDERILQIRSRAGCGSAHKK
jgi:hypothetical protein